jgi:ABC-type uncharacterized transport system fused permease/ATPase subunit
MAKALPAGEEERRLVMARFWQSALGFWRGTGAPVAWALTIALVAIVLAQITVQYQITVWNREFFDALERRDGSTVWAQCLLLAGLAAISVALAVSSVASRFFTHIRWRRHLSNGLLDHWFWNGRYYRLNMMAGDHDNPELRIADDARVATDAPIDFAVGLLSAAVGAVTFITVLWRVGGGIEVAGWMVPGYLVVAAILYSSMTTGAMVLVGRSFVSVAETQELGRGRPALLRGPPARERREHRAAGRRARGARGPGPPARPHPRRMVEAWRASTCARPRSRRATCCWRRPCRCCCAPRNTWPAPCRWAT